MERRESRDTKSMSKQTYDLYEHSVAVSIEESKPQRMFLASNIASGDVAGNKFTIAQSGAAIIVDLGERQFLLRLEELVLALHDEVVEPNKQGEPVESPNA